MAIEVTTQPPVVQVTQPSKMTDERSAAKSESGKQVPPTGEAQPEAAAQSEVELQQAVDMLADRASRMGRDLQFEIDNDSGKTLIKVIDPETDEVVRQIPSEEAVARAKSLDADAMSLLDDIA